MSDEARNIPVVDPDNVPETLCEGMFNFSTHGNHGTVVFTQFRADAQKLMKDGQLDLTAIVRARIVMNRDNWAVLRDLLTQVLSAEPGTGQMTASASKH